MNESSEDDEDGLWEKPAWAKKGGFQLKKTGFADAMKTEGNLAAPITFTPFKNEDHSNYVAHQGRLRPSDVGEAVLSGENLAAPITFTPYKNEDHSNQVANQGRLRQSEVGEAVKSGENLAAPITFTPYKNEDHSNKVAHQGRLRQSDVGEAVKSGEDLAAPITFTPFKNHDHTNKVANQSRLGKSHHDTKNSKQSPKKNKVGGLTFDAPLPPAFKQQRIQRLAFSKQQERRKNNDTFHSLNSSHEPSSHYPERGQSGHEQTIVELEIGSMSLKKEDGNESSSFEEDSSFASFEDDDDDDDVSISS